MGELIKNIWQSIALFAKQIPRTLKESSTWLLLSYLIPIINILLIFLLNYNSEKNLFNALSVYSIIFTTNACFIIFVLNDENKRKLLNLISIVTYTISLLFFVLVIYEIENENTKIPIIAYQYATIGSVILCVLAALISKYDETKALSEQRADEAKNVNETRIGNRKVKL